MPVRYAIKGEYQVNSVSSPSSVPTVAGLSDGSFVVAWQNAENGGDVKAQLFTANGEKFLTEFRVSADKAGAQTAPSVTALDTGGFVIAWNSDGNVKSQAFNLRADKVGAEFTVDLPDYPATVTEGNYLSNASPEVTDLAGPGYVLGWALEHRQVIRPGDGTMVYNSLGIEAQAQLVTDGGTGRGGIIGLTDFMPTPAHVDIAGLTNGGFVVTYRRVFSSRSATVFQIRDANGALATAQTDTSIGPDSAITGLPTGGFALVAPAYSAQSNANSSLGVGVYGNTGSTTANISTMVPGLRPSVAASSNGYFLAAFEYFENPATSDLGIRAQLFDKLGNPAGPTLDINEVKAGQQENTDVTFLMGSRAVVVWRDGNTGDIKAIVFGFTPDL